VVFPIIASLPNGKIERIAPIDPIEHNNFDEVATFLRLKILSSHNIRRQNYISDNNGRVFGAALTSGYIIYFKPIKTGVVAASNRIPVNLNAKPLLQGRLDVEIELYNLLIIDISHYLNKASSPDAIAKGADWKQKLLSAYSGIAKWHDSAEYINNDLSFARKNQFTQMNYFKKYKMTLLKMMQKDEVKALFLELMEPHVYDTPIAEIKLSGNILRNQENSSTIINQYYNRKLRIPKKLFLEYINFISNEYVANEMRRYQILNEKFSEFSSIFEFRSTDDYIIKPI
jgi:hypothetical protein